MAKRRTKATAKKTATKKRASRSSGASARAARAKRSTSNASAAKKTPVKAGTKAKTAASKKSVNRVPKRASSKSAKKNAAKGPAKRVRVAKKAVKATESAKMARTVKQAAGSTAARRAAKLAEPVAPAPMTVQWGDERIELVDQDKKIPKTKLTKRALQSFGRMLLDKRQELVGNMENLSNEALNSNQASGGLSSMPLHMADLGTDNWEQEFTLGLIESERSLVREIDDALSRIGNRTYGVCLATHRRIDTARLRAKPWAKFCIEYARLRELGRVP